MTFSSPNVLKQQIQDAIETLPPNLLPLILDLINLLRSRYPGPPPKTSKLSPVLAARHSPPERVLIKTGIELQN